MRIWLQKQKKKGDQKSTPQIATPPVEAASVAPEGQDAAESADNADASGGSDPKKEETDGRPAPSAEGEETNGSQPPLSAGPATNEVSIFCRPVALSIVTNLQKDSANQEEGVSPAGNVDTTKSTDGADTTVEPSDPTAIAQDTEMQAGSGYGNETMVNNNMGAMNGMPGQFGFGFPNQANFGMGYNGMNPMGGMPNMMGNNGWNNMNPMGMLTHNGALQHRLTKVQSSTI